MPKSYTGLWKPANIRALTAMYPECIRSVDMAKTNTAFAHATKTPTTAQKPSNMPSVTGTGSVYLSVRDVVLGPNRSKTFTPKSDHPGSADKK
jgi:hypothetical protein